MTICLVTDRRQLSPNARTARDEVSALIRWLNEAVAAGIDLIQLRERDLPARLMEELAHSVRAVTAGSKTRLVVNDRADVAVAAGCDGVHVRGDGPPVARLRALEARARKPLMIGRSVHSVAESAAEESADYVLFGAVFDSGPKSGLGIDALREAAAVSDVARGLGRTGLGVIAIGGLTVPRAVACMVAGAAGVAAIRLFLPVGRAEGALGLSAAVAQLRGAFDAAATGHLQ